MAFLKSFHSIPMWQKTTQMDIPTVPGKCKSHKIWWYKVGFFVLEWVSCSINPPINMGYGNSNFILASWSSSSCLHGLHPKHVIHLPLPSILWPFLCFSVSSGSFTSWNIRRNVSLIQARKKCKTLSLIFPFSFVSCLFSQLSFQPYSPIPYMTWHCVTKTIVIRKHNVLKIVFNH